jgi:glutathione peroxidase
MIVRSIALLIVFVIVAAFTGVDDTKKENAVPAALNFTMNSLNGKPVNLSKYHGKVVLMVNVASQCGYTPQYKQLQALHEKYKDKGLAILGFPANNFGEQEPGTESEIASFCEKNYGVKFDLFSKVSVKGDDICPLYKHLTTTTELDEPLRGEVKWNFEKFLIGRDGKVVNRFRSKIAPDSEDMVKAIDAELAKPAN